MDADEEFARMLQKQFDEEAVAVESQEQLDTKLAQRLASKSHQFSDSSEDEEGGDIFSSIQGTGSNNKYQEISSNLKKHSKNREHSPTEIAQDLRRDNTSTSRSNSLAHSSSCSHLQSPSSSKAIGKPASPTKSYSSEQLGSRTKLDILSKSQNKDAQSPSKIKNSPFKDRKGSLSSSTKFNTSKKQQDLNQSAEALFTLGERKVSRDTVSCTPNKEKYGAVSKRKSVVADSSVGKLPESPKTVNLRKQQESPHKLESVTNKKLKPTVTSSSASDCSIVKSLSDPGSSPSKASSSDKESDGSPFDRRPLCKYGVSCYRTNAIHLKEFKHCEDSATGVRKKKVPEADLKMTKAKSDTAMRRTDEKHVDLKLKLLIAKNSPEKSISPVTKDSSINLKRHQSQTDSNEPPLKKKKSGENSSTSGKDSPKGKGFAARLAASEPYRLFLTKSFSVSASHWDPLGCVLPDLLNRSLGTVVETAQLSFVVDLDFVFESYMGCGIADKPLLLLYGEMEGETSQFSKGTFVKVKMPFLYGTHHTKMMLLLYTEGLRVVVHTANLRPDDWYEKTQGVWVSPLFPKMDVKPATPGCPSSGDSPTLFRQDLLQYLQSYRLSPLSRWCDIIRRHDFAQCNAVFVGHVPGYHAGPALPRYGLLKLRRALGHHTDKEKWRGHDALKKTTTFIQCSSIGSLGKDATWISQDLGASLSGGMGCPASKVMVIYPSEEDVRLSSQGWGGGSCLPYQSGTHAKQTWLVKHLHCWRSGERHRTKAMPHIKTYTRVMSSASGALNTTDCEAQYLLLTSANLSKAAWGQVQKQGAQLFIRSYEAGVLLIPKFVTGEDSFALSGSRPLPLPFDLPPSPYTSSDRPWLMDTNKKNKDVNGDTYP